MNDIEIAKKYVNKSRDARRRGIPFDLTFTSYKNLMRAKRCAYTGLELTVPRRGKNTIGTDRTIDRIDNKKGYTKGNVVAVCHAVNQIKATVENPNNSVTFKHIERMIRRVGE